MTPEAVCSTWDVSRETADRLVAYSEILLQWNARINLIGRATEGDLWHRHIADSAQLFDFLPDPAARWLDIGSGGGLPGIVIAIFAAEMRPDLSVMLVESDQRKAAFLRAAARQCGISVDIKAERIEAFKIAPPDVLSARALASLARLFELSEHLVSSETTLLLPKGARWRKEMTEALENWSFDCEETPSSTDEHGVILKIGDLKRV